MIKHAIPATKQVYRLDGIHETYETFDAYEIKDALVTIDGETKRLKVGDSIRTLIRKARKEATKFFSVSVPSVSFEYAEAI